MHMLSAANRSEFLACPQLIRFEFAEGMDGHEPTLLIKANNLLLKFVVAGVPMTLIFAPLPGRRFLYALKIMDDEDHPAVIWSVLERAVEKSALGALARGEPLQLFLFNELAVCVAWAETRLAPIPAEALALLESSELGAVEHGAISEAAGAIFDAIHLTGQSPAGGAILDVPAIPGWKTFLNSYVTNQAGSSQLELLDPDEGGQQEELVIWLTDNLQIQGAIRSPQVPKGAGTRELTDILLAHDQGSILVESKALGTLQRLSRPNRAKLTKGVKGHIAKAVNQLGGAIRELRANAPVTDLKGRAVAVERTAPPHAIILIPDLALLSADPEFGASFMAEFCRANSAIVHILDPAELLRIVQAAQALAERDPSAKAIEAFDCLLTMRAEQVLEADHLCISILHRIE